MPDAPTPFFRLLHTPIDAKGDALAAQVEALNATGGAENAFLLDPAAFAEIPGSPFAYWVGSRVLEVFADFDQTENGERVVRVSNETGDDFRFMRLWTEVLPSMVGRNGRWVPHAKGGPFSQYYQDLHLLIAWDDNRNTIRGYFGRPARPDERMASTDFFFRPGLTYPRRTNRFSVRVLASGAVFSNKGVGVFFNNDAGTEALATLAVMSSESYLLLIYLLVGHGMLARSFEVGVIQRLPYPKAQFADKLQLADLAGEAHDLQRDRDRTDETTHAFGLPGLVQERAAGSLAQASQALDRQEQARYSRLTAIQAEIDDIVMRLYGLTIDDLGLTIEPSQSSIVNRQSEIENPDDDEDDKAPALPENLPRRVADLIQWCVGAAFGRWDVRMALDPTLLPALQGPFDPLPRCAPGALIGVDGLPPQSAEDIAPEAWLRGRENVLDLRLTIDDLRLEDAQSSIVNQQSSIPPSSIAWDGILVDDSTHPSDIVARVREVLGLLWGPRAGAIEQEACAILGFPDLRSYFRDPRKGFFAFHIKRYSKSRRRAPIYWLLQSERRNYGIWLYYHRLRRYSLYEAGRTYADAKVRLEEGRLEELRQTLTVLQGASRRRREQEIERQQKLAAEVTALRNTLDQVALLDIPPDPNDGVVLGIAPLHKLVPWPEAARYWQQLVAGDFGWSTMSQQMQRKRLMIND